MLPVSAQSFSEIAAGYFAKDTNVLSKYSKIISLSITINTSNMV